ncbi:uncharacterized protein P884DRAFT_101478 [Thermothelomyces heterothallicus CBS 202.75]|uniref:uncharacterized protein n=1 Tax=Thermothelomyces heterothallicus CBS 202.75 TaxID=1149848 RepID=UPI00374460D9
MAIPSPATAAAPAAAPSPPSSSAAPSSEAPSAEAPSATAAAPAASSAMANSVAEKETAAEPDPDPWPQIEHNYFTSMRLHREREDAALAEAYHAKTDPLRQRLVDNYNAQAELLRQLRALREQYDTAQAELGALEEEWQELMDEKRREREREDEERRAWFRKYRRGGLAYRGAGAATATATATTTAAATAADAAANGSDVNGQGNAERDGERRKVGGSRVDGLDKGGEGEVEAEVSNGQQSQARANGEEQKREENEPEREGSGEEHDKGAAEQAERNGMEVDAQPSALAKSLEVVGFAQGREKGQEHQQPANGDRDAPGVPSSVNDHTEKPRFEPERVDDDKRASDGQGDTVSEDRPTNEHSSPPVAGQGEGESRTVEAVREDERAKSSLAERNTAEAVPSVTTVKSIEMDSSETVNGFDLPRHIASPPTTEAGSPVKSRTRDQQLESAEPTADAQQGGIENTQNASRVEISGINGTVGRRDGDGDVEMTDAQIRAENDTNSALGNDRPQAASAALGAPASPSSSSELSSRSTTPELDTPVYLGRDPSPPETPEQKSLGNIEILGESGDPIGRVKAEDFGNSVMSRIVQLPVKRPVQICSGRKFTTDDLDAVERPEPGNARPSRFVSLFVQATGELQARPCLDCTADGGPYLDCVMVDDPEFPRCGNCEWNQRRCQGGTTGRASDSRQNLTSKSPADSPTKRRASSGGPTAINPAAENRESREEFKPSTSNSDGRDSREAATKKGPRKSLPGSRNVPLPSTPSTSVQDEGELLPEITKDVLSLKHDGVVFTDPPIMRGVPLAKISPEHPYWEPDWKPLEAIVEPVWQKHQEKYDQLERSGTTYRDKHLANRDAKRGRLILKFLEEGDLHPYQLVGKQWINHRLTNYDTLYRLAQLLTDELPKMNLDVTPSEWLRHRLHELYLEHGDKLDVANWIRRAYHDRKIEQLRLKNGFPRVGRPPAHVSKSTEPGGSSKKATGPRSLKRKDPHQTPESTPSKSKTGSTLRESPSAASDAGSSSAAATAKTGGPGQQPKPKKIKIITSQPQLQPSSKPPSTKAPKIILNSPYPQSATSDKAPALKGSRAAAKGKEDDQGSALEYDGYTSSDSISGDTLHVNDWRLHQVKTRTFATNPQVTQYWHWVTEQKEHNLIEHQVLESVGPPVKWSIFKRPYNFHLKLPDIQEVSFARASNRVVVTHRRGRDGKDLAPRGDIMAEFKRDRTKRRFLTFLRRDKGVKVIELSRDAIEAKWNSLSPETLPGPDSD